MSNPNNKHVLSMNANESYRRWLQENPSHHTDRARYALVWSRHMMTHEDHEEGTNLIEQSFPQWNIMATYYRQFGRQWEHSYNAREIQAATRPIDAYRALEHKLGQGETIVIATPEGSVTVEESGCEQYTIVHLDMSEEDQDEFWSRFTELWDDELLNPCGTPGPKWRAPTRSFGQLQRRLTQEQIQIVNREIRNGRSSSQDDVRWTDIEAILATARMTGYQPLSHGNDEPVSQAEPVNHAAEQSREIETFLRGMLVQGNAVYEAAEAERSLQVFADRDDLYRTHVFAGPKGSVAFWNDGNGWCDVGVVDMSETDTARFWHRLWSHVVNNPDEDNLCHHELGHTREVMELVHRERPGLLAMTSSPGQPATHPLPGA